MPTHHPQPWTASIWRLWRWDLGEELVAASFQGSHLAAKRQQLKDVLVGYNPNIPHL